MRKHISNGILLAILIPIYVLFSIIGFFMNLKDEE